MTRRSAYGALLVALVTLPYGSALGQAAPRRVIFFIGDGAGTAAWTAARLSADALAVAGLPVTGLVDTRNASGRIPDSAASATAYASGIRTFDGAIGVGPDSQPATTVLEIARARGMATGLVVTSAITHATPAAFGAHVPDRSLQFEIARQLAGQGIDVLLGGGRRWFQGTVGPDSTDLLGTLRSRYTVVDSVAALRSLGMDSVRALLGLFADDGMPAAPTREPTLAEMTDAALTLLDRDPKGFFLMVEGSQIDWREHDDASLEEVTAEVLDLDRAIAAAVAYRRARPETLIIVTADHETGGLAIVQDSTGAFAASYASTEHTAAMVPLFAIGPGAERFGGMHDIDWIGRALIAYVQGGATAR